MVKIGKFKGLEVYGVSYNEWQEMTTNTENLWVVDRKKVYYHDQMIAWLNSRNELQDFDEELFEYLRDKYSNKNKYVTREGTVVKEKADEEPQSASEIVNESVDPAAAVDSFMNSWKSNIDNEIAVLKSSVAQMEDMINAVG